jgi:hypothetical protein
MPYALLADLVLIVHAAFVLFVVLGGFLVLFRRRFALVHIPAVVWGVLIEFRGWICPLTYLENHWRTLAGARGYSGAFIDHYLVPLIYPPGLTADHQLILGVALIVINAVIYFRVFTKRSPDRVPSHSDPEQ